MYETTMESLDGFRDIPDVEGNEIGRAAEDPKNTGHGSLARGLISQIIHTAPKGE